MHACTIPRGTPLSSGSPRRSSGPPPYWCTACAELSDRDAVLSRLIATHRDDVLHGSGDGFRTLLNAVVGQQISVAAAAKMWGRLASAYPTLDPKALARAPIERFREFGLSLRKAEYVRGIASAVDKGLINPESWHARSEAEVRAELTAQRGVGPWTAEMVLIFHARRPDILPVGDVGLVNAAARLYEWDQLETLRERRDRLARYAEGWRPWRTVATWFLWRDLDAEPVVY